MRHESRKSISHKVFHPWLIILGQNFILFSQAFLQWRLILKFRGYWGKERGTALFVTRWSFLMKTILPQRISDFSSSLSFCSLSSGDTEPGIIWRCWSGMVCLLDALISSEGLCLLKYTKIRIMKCLELQQLSPNQSLQPSVHAFSINWFPPLPAG